MALFVLLWSSGAIASRMGLDHGSPLAFLTLRYGIALAVVSVIAYSNGNLLLPRTEWLRVAVVGLLINGLYAICYLFALEHGITPGILTTILGVQPVITVALTEKRVKGQRAAGLALAFAGLVLALSPSVTLEGATIIAVGFALTALASMAAGAILQQRETLSPIQVMPLQYIVGLAACSVVAPFQPFWFSWSVDFLLPLLWMAIVISVAATLLFYRMIQTSNLVNTTSVFYLVPIVTAILDLLLLGNMMALTGMLGMALIVFGIIFIFRSTPVLRRSDGD
ncbi:MAG: DMT family transporter, partial [Sphingorhabdus sp.]|uniref:DMT family transporter n=1 Tax=Sphingorhabdus sp. TaxID=1902408 RepID=UPI003C8F9698